MCQGQHCDEQQRDDPGTCFYFLGISAENTDHDVGDQAEGNSVGNVVGKGHHGKGQEGGNRGFEVVPIDVLDRRYHQDADVNQRGGGGATGNQLCHGAEEHGHKEE